MSNKRLKKFSFAEFFQNILDRIFGIDRRPQTVRDYEQRLRVLFATSCERVK